MNPGISTIVIPMTRKDITELHELFKVMPAPGGQGRPGGKRRLIVSLDLGLDGALRENIAAAFAENRLERWFDLDFLDCGLAPDESFYLRAMPEDFDRQKYPYGLKSGPNLQFFRTLQQARRLSSPEGAVMLLETDMTPLMPGWLHEIEAEVRATGDFLVAGSAYAGTSELAADIRNHINGASVYNWSHPDFPDYLSLWDEVVRLACRFAPWHAYDVIPEWICFNAHRFEDAAEAETIRRFVALYRARGKRIGTIANLSGPAERHSREPLPASYLFDRACLHLRADLATRRDWQNRRGSPSGAAGIAGLAVDRDWQYPAITEQHAFARLRDIRLNERQRDATYFAFPWATLMDFLLHKPEKADPLLAELRRRSAALKSFRTVATVCQHIHMKEFMDIMANAGITDIFWSHATHRDVACTADLRIRIHPFPLFPVQTAAATLADMADEGAERQYLFSFIGSFAPRYYLTQSRNHIIERLGNHPRGLVVERKEWHYNTVVYKHQVRGQAKVGADLVDGSKSQEFREALYNSTFALCPSGSGPNSIRLWESIGAGAIPVILADTWAPPGDRRLWEMGAVFCKETAEDIAALPDLLAGIAADPLRLGRMRHALRQLWLLYGPQTFVSDVLGFLLDRTGSPEPRTEIKEEIAAETGSEAHSGPAAAVEEARLLLLSWSSRLLLEPAAALAALAAEPGLPGALDRACTLTTAPGLPAHFRSVLAHAGGPAADGPSVGQSDRTGREIGREIGTTALTAPRVARRAAPKIALLGRHARRTPLSYPPLRRRVGDRLAWVDDPTGADLLLTGFNIDWRENIEVLAPLLARPRPPALAVMSEEPLWDVTWSGPFTGRAGRMTVGTAEVAYTFLGHETSDIFRFDRLPYFVLTDDRFPLRYAAMMARLAGTAPAALLARWQAAPIGAAFFAEKRQGDSYVGGFPDRDVTRLSSYRSTVAELSQGPGVLRVGKGWGAPVQRQDLPDWHLDKLALLDGRVRMATAYENVHQHNYISEKIFDAIAVGGVPVYWAGPRHRIFELVPDSAMLNTVGLDPAAAAARIAGFVPDLALAESWLETCAHLARLFGDFRVIAGERQRVADAAVAEILALV